MFGLSYSEFVQGSALRTWNCVAHFASLLWYKFNHLRDPIMPRSRRRHHSRSRSRSRSHSHERDREPKRRKIETYESPHHRRTVSSEPEAIDCGSDDGVNKLDQVDVDSKVLESSSKENSNKIEIENTLDCIDNVAAAEDSDLETNNDTDNFKVKDSSISKSIDDTSSSRDNTPSKLKEKSNDLKITPKKVGSPIHLQKKLESEKKRQEKLKEKDERDRKKLDEKEEKQRKKLEEKQRITEEKLRVKQEKEEQKNKEKLAKEEKKKKEQEEKDKKRREKEEKDEQKKKEREQEKMKKLQEIEEKNKEKQKIEEQKQKTAAAFANFFVSKKTEVEEKKLEDSQAFMPFEIKSDMRLAPIIRKTIANDDKPQFEEILEQQVCNKLYLDELKEGKEIGKSGKTWLFEDVEQDDEDDVIIVEENVGETIVEQKPKKMRAKFLKFEENQRPPYFGTFKKKSKIVGPRKPFGKDDIFNYDIDSDEEWEEEGEGESLKGTDDEEERDNDLDDYEEDNEVFVPHDYLSADEGNDEENAALSPESQKLKLKLLKKEFDEQMKSKTQRLKPKVIGCIWYSKTKSNVEEAIDRCLQPFAIICNGQIEIKKRSDFAPSSVKKVAKLLSKEHVPLFLKQIHGSVEKRKNIVKHFIEYMSNNGMQLEVSQKSLGNQLKKFAHWQKCPEEGAMHNKMCWYVAEDIRKEYNVDVNIANKSSLRRAQIK